MGKVAGPMLALRTAGGKMKKFTPSLQLGAASAMSAPFFVATKPVSFR
jgi:hypothetical protein